jgi:signal transduction histidine kinase
LEFILDTAVSLLNCEGASIMLFDDRKQELWFAASTISDSDELAKVPVPLDNSIAGNIIKSQTPAIIDDVENDPRHFKEVEDQTQFSVRTLLGVPMSIQDRTVGVLQALNKNNGNFNAEDLELFQIVASQAAVAINNANLVQALQLANEELSQADKLKNDFMAVASHELRTPLGIILGYASFLKEDAGGDLTTIVESILNAAVRLETVVDSMTHMSLLYTGEADLKLEPTEIQKVIFSAYQRVISSAEAQNNEIVLKLPKKPTYINADLRLELVFVNVLNNAVRFTPDGGEIFVSMSPTNDEVLIMIRDVGIGIPSESLEKVFDYFYQVEDHLTRNYGGLGLGLSIAQALTNLHGGRIWAESEGLEKGTAIYISLPILI